ADLVVECDLQDELKDFFEDFRWKTLACQGQRRVVGRLLIQGKPQKLPQAEAVGATTRDTSLTVDPFEVADQQHTKEDARWKARLPPLLFLFVILNATLFNPVIEARFGQKLVQLLVERMTLRPGQIVRRNEQRLLPTLALPHRHAKIPTPSNHRPRVIDHSASAEYFNRLLGYQRRLLVDCNGKLLRTESHREPQTHKIIRRKESSRAARRGSRRG